MEVSVESSGSARAERDLSEAGFANPIIRHAGADGPSDVPGTPGRAGSPDLPDDWRPVQERKDESYRWPKRRDTYSPYRVFIGTTRTEGAVQIGLGETVRENAWGRDRKYVVADQLPAVYAERFRTPDLQRAGAGGVTGRGRALSADGQRGR